MERIKNLLRASAFALCALLAPRHAATTTGTARTPARCSAPTRSTERVSDPSGSTASGTRIRLVRLFAAGEVRRTAHHLFLLRAGRCLHRERGVARPPLPHNDDYIFVYEDPFHYYSRFRKSRRAVRPTCVEPGGRSLSGEARHHAARRQVVLLRFRRPAGDSGPAVGREARNEQDERGIRLPAGVPLALRSSDGVRPPLRGEKGRKPFRLSH